MRASKTVKRLEDFRKNAHNLIENGELKDFEKQTFKVIINAVVEGLQKQIIAESVNEHVSKIIEKFLRRQG